MNRKFALYVMAAFAATAMAGAARANDSASELAAGGLVLVKTEGVAMQREDLSLSASEVKVRYEMRNDRGQPVTLRVAFPMPEVPKDTPGGMETSGGGYNIDLKPPSQPNFMKFRVWADGKEITPEVEVRAVLKDGRNIADGLKEIGGWALVMRPRVYQLSDQPKPVWDLDEAARKKLVALGAIEQDKDAYDTQWQTFVTFHWQQVFPPGVTVIEHSYAPVLGYHLMTPKEKIGWTGTDEAKEYCIDAGTAKALQSLYLKILGQRRDKNDAYIGVFNLAYILHTAGNWDGPIGTFHLTLNETPVPGLGNGRMVGLISLCTDLPLRKTGPGRFEATVQNYQPVADLRVLMVPQ